MRKIIAIILCGLILTGCAAQTQPPSTVQSEIIEPATTLTPETTPIEIPVNIFVPDENAEHFNTIPTVISTADAEEIVALLIEHSMLNTDISLNKAEIVGNQLNLDFNKTFSDQLNTYGTSGERMMIGCVVNTFLSVYDAETVYITINGEIMESGHVIYDFPMGFFE